MQLFVGIVVEFLAIFHRLLQTFPPTVCESFVDRFTSPKNL